MNNVRRRCLIKSSSLTKDTSFRKIFSCRYFSAVPQTNRDVQPGYSLCHNDPIHHTREDLMKFYSISDENIKSKLVNVYPKKFKFLTDMLHEVSLMIRKPSMDVISSIESNEGEQQKFILYGPGGTGKSVSMLHVIHYCLLKDWLVVHVPHAARFADTKSKVPVQPSTWNDKRVDQPEEAIHWLHQFRTMNTAFLLNNKTTQRYSWGKREVTEQDKPLMEVVEQGISRNIYSSDAIGVLLKEIRLNESLQVLYAIDGFNGLYGRTEYQLNGITVDTERLSLIHHFTKPFKPEFELKKSAYVLALSHSIANLKSNKDPSCIERVIPGNVLNELGKYEKILVPNYNDNEFLALLHFYKDKNWIGRELTPQLVKEMKFITACNPVLINKMCASL